MIVIGDGAITTEMRANGYVATICGLISGSMSPDMPEFQDLHVTRKHLEDLQSRIAQFLKHLDREAGGKNE
jgi:uncharacterized protein YceH (UPF0502 family)